MAPQHERVAGRREGADAVQVRAQCALLRAAPGRQRHTVGGAFATAGAPSAEAASCAIVADIIVDASATGGVACCRRGQGNGD